MFRKLLLRISLYGLAPQVPKIASIFVLPIITQDLTTLDYGVAGVISAYAAAFSVLQTLGMNVVMSNSFYKSPNFYKWHWRQIHGFLSIWSLAFAAILAGILYFVIPEEATHNRWMIILLNIFPVAFLGTTQNMSQRFFHLSLKAKTLAMRTVITGLISVFINLYTISYLKLGYMGWFWSACLSNVAGFLLLFYPFYFKYKFWPIFNFKKRTVRKALSVSLPTVPHYYSNYLLKTSDKAIMDVLHVDVKNIGLYNLASTFGNYFGSFVDAISLAVSPTYLKLYRKGDDAALLSLKKLTFLLQGGLLLISFTLCLWLKEIFMLMIRNEELRKAYPIAIIIIMSFTYRPMYLAAINKIFMQEKTKSLMKITFAAGIANVILNFILIPIYGVEAAAIITFVTFLYMGYSGFFMKEFKGIKDKGYQPVMWLLITLAVSFIAYLGVEFYLYVKVFITFLLAVSVGLFLFKYGKNLKNIYVE